MHRIDINFFLLVRLYLIRYYVVDAVRPYFYIVYLKKYSAARCGWMIKLMSLCAMKYIKIFNNK